MFKQVGVSNFIMTLYSVDLRRNELIPVISKLNKQDLSEKKIQKLLHQDWCKLLNSNPALVARHFHYRFNVFI